MIIIMDIRGRVCGGRVSQGPSLLGAEFVRGPDAQLPVYHIDVDTVTPMRLEPVVPRSRVKHSTTEPLRSHQPS